MPLRSHKIHIHPFTLPIAHHSQAPCLPLEALLNAAKGHDHLPPTKSQSSRPPCMPIGPFLIKNAAKGRKRQPHLNRNLHTHFTSPPAFLPGSAHLQAVDHSTHVSSPLRRFFPIENAAKGRKRWILSVPVRGQLWLDAGAVTAVKDQHKSLFCPGIIKVGGWVGVGAVTAVKDRHKSLFCPGIIKVGGWVVVGTVTAVQDRHKSLFCPGIIKVVGWAIGRVNGWI